MTLPYRTLALLLAAGALACSTASTPPPDAGGGNDAGIADGGTWYRDVLPVMYASCQHCHVAGGIAPFPLVTYQDGLEHAGIMASYVQAGLMPPWKPAPGCETFLGDRSIPQSMKDAIINWADTGAAEGNPADAPPAPDAGAVGLPRVDAELDAGFDYMPMVINVADDYHCFILDPGLTQSTYVTGVNIIPGQPTLVHHVILFSMPKATAQSLDTSGQGWTCFGGPGTGSFDMLGGWVPGSPAQVFPANTGVSLQAGNVIVMQVHYNLSTAAPQPDRTVAQLMYSPTVQLPAVIDGPVDTGFAIPPNTMGYSVTYPYTIPVNATIWGVLPHMHTLGSQINVSLTDAAGNSSCLVDVPQWSFYWQQMYFYQQPVTVTAGETVNLQCTWNNTTNNTVTFGEDTSDEMCLAFFYATQ